MTDNHNFTTCWNIILQNGMPLFFCDAQESISIDGYEYIADPAFFRSSAEHDMSVTSSNMEINGIITSSAITYDDVKNGLYQNAIMEVFLYNLEELKKVRTIFYGYISQVDFSEDKISAQMRDFSTSLANKFGDIYSPQCRAIFGSHKCGMNLDDHRFKAEIVKVISPIKIKLSKNFDSNYFKFGNLKIIGDKNSGATELITGNMGYVVNLIKPFNMALEQGMTVELTAGCDKTIGTCATKFCNAQNFRGEPFVPNIDKVI